MGICLNTAHAHACESVLLARTVGRELWGLSVYSLLGDSPKVGLSARCPLKRFAAAGLVMCLATTTVATTLPTSKRLRVYSVARHVSVLRRYQSEDWR